MPSVADMLQERAGRFAVRALKFLRTVPRQPSNDIIVRQATRSATGIPANYRATRRARSRAEFIARLGVVVEEADETVGWLETLESAGLAAGDELNCLITEARELRAIFAKSLSTARSNNPKR